MSALGDVDLHLAGEGRHERLYERLGAHVLDDGGVRFAVWAPNARSVSVAGDWNYWSEGTDPLRATRRLGDLGGSRRERARGAALQALRRRRRRHHAAEGGSLRDVRRGAAGNGLDRLPKPLPVVGRRNGWSGDGRPIR